MPTNLYGAGDNYDSKTSHVMAALIKKFYEAKKLSLPSVTCWGTGQPLREFLHVDDLAEAAVFLLGNWDPKSPFAPKDVNGDSITILNVGTGLEISIKELAFKIAKYINYKGKIMWDTTEPDGTPRKRLNINRVKKLGWQPKISLDEGIKQTLKSFEKEIQK